MDNEIEIINDINETKITNDINETKITNDINEIEIINDIIEIEIINDINETKITNDINETIDIIESIDINETKIINETIDIIESIDIIETNVKIIFVCHNNEVTNSILNDPTKKNACVLFVGYNEINDQYLNNERVIIVRNLPENIEVEKDLLTFTAWYAIIKNNLFPEYDYLCILEYDVILNDNFESSLIQLTNKSEDYDIISFIPINFGFTLDIKENIIKYFLKTKQIDYYVPNNWYATTNHCIKRDILSNFIDWYYPSCLLIKKLDPVKISWYHERIFSIYCSNYKLNIIGMEGLSHQFSNSHKSLHTNLYDISSQLIDLYINNSSCELINKIIDNYKTFVSLLENDFTPGIGSYLTDGINNVYDGTKYNKQKLLFENVKNVKNVLITGDYRGHISFIILLANPNLKITCIEKNDYKLPFYINNGSYNFNIIRENKDQERIFLLNTFEKDDFDFDLIHISQIYPERGYIYNYLDIIGEKCKSKNIKLIIDDFEVYNPNFKENFLNSNINCKIINEVISKCVYPNLLLEIKINKMYFLVYNDESGEYDENIQQLTESVKTFSHFEVIIFNKKDIDLKFKEQNEDILTKKRGGGYWLWKPYIINETLKNIDEQDILFYCDSKYYFTEPFKNLFYNKMQKDIIIWKNKPNESSYYLKQWCKMDVIKKYNMYNETFIYNCEICWAGCIVLRKTTTVSNLIKRWLLICCNENDITDIPSTISNSPDYSEHRHDQSLLSIVLHEFNIKLHYFEKKYLQNVRSPY